MSVLDPGWVVCMFASHAKRPTLCKQGFVGAQREAFSPWVLQAWPSDSYFTERQDRNIFIRFTRCCCSRGAYCLTCTGVRESHTSQQVRNKECAVVSNTPRFVNDTSFPCLLRSPPAVYFAVSCFALHHKPPTVKAGS